MLFVGAGPAGLAGAIRWRDWSKPRGRLGEIEIGVLEKAESLGEHNLSGAVVNPRPVPRAVSRPRRGRLPVPAAGRPAKRVYCLTRTRRPPHPDAGRRCTTTATTSASICEIVRWLGETGRGAGRQRLHRVSRPSRLLVEGDAVVGVRTTRRPGSTATATRAAATCRRTTSPREVTVLSDGTRSAADPGLARLAGDRLAEPADLRARRQGAVGGRSSRSTR